LSQPLNSISSRRQSHSHPRRTHSNPKSQTKRIQINV
jgi:hypothetical protein